MESLPPYASIRLFRPAILEQREGGPVKANRPGDVVWFSPGEKHWHGATRTTAMTHIAIQEKKDGNVVDWMEQVSDEQYRKSLRWFACGGRRWSRKLLTSVREKSF
jgi:hypothetical protein